MCDISIYMRIFVIFTYSLSSGSRTDTPWGQFRKGSGNSNPATMEEPSGTVSIISNSSYTDSSGNLHIDGEVYNEMPLKTAMDVQVVATFYDTNGKVVRTTRAFTEPKDLPSGENATFDVPLYSANIPQANRYELAVAWR
jgi:hypothetical protein